MASCTLQDLLAGRCPPLCLVNPAACMPSTPQPADQLLPDTVYRITMQLPANIPPESQGPFVNLLTSKLAALPYWTVLSVQTDGKQVEVEAKTKENGTPTINQAGGDIGTAVAQILSLGSSILAGIGSLATGVVWATFCFAGGCQGAAKLTMGLGQAANVVGTVVQNVTGGTPSNTGSAPSSPSSSGTPQQGDSFILLALLVGAFLLLRK